MSFSTSNVEPAGKKKLNIFNTDLFPFSHEMWLKDRKGRTLTEEETEHYQKVVVALNETIRIMKAIDEVSEEYVGWPVQ